MRRSPSLSGSPASLRRRRQLRNEEEIGGDNNLKHVTSADGGSYDHDDMLRAFSETESTRLLKKPPQLDKSSSISSTAADSNTKVASLSHWIVPALLCAMSYALYNIFIKKGSASIHPILGGVILQFVAAIIGLVLLLILTFGPSEETMFYDNSGIYYSVLAGISVGAAEIISFTVSGMGVPATQSIPIIIGGSVFFGTLLGKIFLGVMLSLTGWLGVLLIAVGIVLVATDPNSSLE